MATVPAGATTGPAKVFVNGVDSNLVTFTVPSNTISSVSPTIGPFGTQVTATGRGFGATQGSSTINFNGTPATTIVSWSDTQIVANVPSAATTGPVTVVVNSAGSNATVVFTAVNPVITSLSPPAPF